MAIMKRLILPLALLAALAGCVPSLNPLYTEKDLVFDPALLGVWGEANAKETWTFEKAGEKKYKLLQTDNDGRTGEFEVHLLKLKDHYFLDLYVTEPGGEKWSPNDLARGAIIMRPGHLFLKVTQIQPTLKMAMLDLDWLQKLLEKDPRAVRHEKIRFGSANEKDFQLVLTAETKELQRFILKNVDKAFGDESSELFRRTNSSPAAPAGKK